ncbi:hypothetical protein Ahy_B04g071273 [Arachis hypogaea]|uniref:Aminotransferase-like plant mobile domain-containing protein n=1 Tax=Arachis hypogaea TaxID=3818 RepID=A0A444ZKC5_ARAHY|nr:hypothetical protein Ahy_B04g071273 [Arachis hypogaea]
MSNEKKVIVQKLEFSGLMHIPPMNVPRKLLKELAYSFDLIKIHIGHPIWCIKHQPKKYRSCPCLECIWAALFNQKLTEEDKEVYRTFQGKILRQLIESMMEISVDRDEDRLKFKRIFILYIQMSFLLPTTINKISPIHIPSIFRVDTIREWNWGVYILNFLIKDISEHILKKKKFVDGCLYALIIHWTKELLVQRIEVEIKDHMNRPIRCLSLHGVEYHHLFLTFLLFFSF